MDKVFIAGGTGMLGSETAISLANAGVDVVVSSRKDKDVTGERLEATSTRIKMEKLDLLDADAVAAVFKKHNFTGAVFLAQTHQHALTRDDANKIYPILINCLENARKTGVKRFVLGSSLAIYGGEAPPISEDMKFPTRVGESPTLVKFEVTVKRVLENIALDYGQPFQQGMSIVPEPTPFSQHELEVVALRSPMMFGQGYYANGSPMGVDAHVAAGRQDTFKGHIGYAGLPVEILWGVAAPVPTSYVKDNADCIKTALMADKLKNHIYNIGSGFPCNARKQFDALVAAAPDSLERFGITRDELPDEDHDMGYYSGLFNEDFNWKPLYTLETALADYIAWLKYNPI